MGRVIDVSLGIHPEMLTWPGDPGVGVRPAKRLDRGDSSNVSELQLGTPTGTHVDAPWHFVEGGATVDDLDAEILVGPAVVGDMRHVEDRIGADDLERLDLAPGTSRLLFRTRNSDLWASGRRDFPDDYVALGEDGAEWLVAHEVKLVGTDFLSIERKREDGGHPVHVALLEAGVVIVEGLDLSEVTPELYLLYCLPLKIVGVDGAPARVFLAEP
ncbi:MAG TPA: cyclase family protein [Actinomycetota bacterium]|nr:cyclase family protein [Actinomycetota bacterium]